MIKYSSIVDYYRKRPYIGKNTPAIAAVIGALGAGGITALASKNVNKAALGTSLGGLGGWLWGKHLLSKRVPTPTRVPYGVRMKLLKQRYEI